MRFPPSVWIALAPSFILVGWFAHDQFGSPPAPKPEPVPADVAPALTVDDMIPPLSLPIDDREYVAPEYRAEGETPYPPRPGTAHLEELPDEPDLSPEYEWSTGWIELSHTKKDGKIIWDYVAPRQTPQNGDGVAFRRANGKWQYRCFSVLKKA